MIYTCINSSSSFLPFLFLFLSATHRLPSHRSRRYVATTRCDVMTLLSLTFRGTCWIDLPSLNHDTMTSRYEILS